MRCHKRKIGWLAFLLFLTPAAIWATPLLPGENSFPLPYVYEDKEIADTEPRFTFNESGALPDWLSFAVQHRTRYETFNSQFRFGSTGSDQTLSLRTLAQATVHLHPSFKIQLEFQDSRAELADTGTAMTSSIVNAVALLEANLQWLEKGLFQEGSRSLMRGGRLTMDFGKRRLVSRNRFRNTLNAFTGVDWIWTASDGNQIRMFFTLPVTRLPFDRDSLLENEVEFDKETTDRIFWGIFYANPHLPWGAKEMARRSPDTGTLNLRTLLADRRGHNSPRRNSSNLPKITAFSIRKKTFQNVCLEFAVGFALYKIQILSFN